MALYELVFSPTGRTAQAAAALSKRLGADPIVVDLSARDCDLAALELRLEDVVVVAVPCFGGRVPALAAERLEPLAGNRARAVLLVAYGNRAYDDALVELRDILEARDLRCIAAAAAVCEHSIFRTFAAQRPSVDDIKQLKGFSLQIAQMLMTDDGTLDLGELPGSRPYKEAPKGALVPFADENCTRCGSCVEPCPAGAIPVEDPMQTDGELCIGCMRCVELCPHGVRKTNLLARTQVYRKLQGVCAVPKENELWLAEKTQRPTTEK